MRKQLFGAAGYLSIFLPPILLITGVVLGVPSLAFATVMLVFPLMRTVFGEVRPDSEILWREAISSALDALPFAYATALPLVLGMVLAHVARHSAGTALEAFALGLSLWITMLLSVCVAHELIHRRSARESLLGHCLAGLAGYPLLSHEHLAHHARSGDTLNADWPRIEESVWRFAFRRLARILRESYGSGCAFWNRGTNGRGIRRLRVATLVSLATCAAFIWADGWAGFALYAAVGAGVGFGVQIINYVQHWGLGDDHLGARASGGYAWEDDCRFQAWLTLSLSLHQAHHDASQRPFYRVALKARSPRLPAGYLVLMVLCLFPRIWQRLMLPALEHWERHPSEARSPGRQLTCFSAYGHRRSVPRISR